MVPRRSEEADQCPDLSQRVVRQVEVLEVSCRLGELFVRGQHGRFEEQGEVWVSGVDLERFEIRHFEMVDGLFGQGHDAREAQLRGEPAGLVEALWRFAGKEEEVGERPQDEVATLQIDHAVVDQVQGKIPWRGERQEARADRARTSP